MNSGSRFVKNLIVSVVIAIILAAACTVAPTITIEIKTTTTSANASPSTEQIVTQAIIESPIVQDPATATIKPEPITTLSLPDKYEKVAGVDEVPLPEEGPGLWRVYDEKAQVVCYVYGVNQLQRTGSGEGFMQSWSGLSCLSVANTSLGK